MLMSEDNEKLHTLYKCLLGSTVLINNRIVQILQNTPQIFPTYILA